jgi:hypothetical protein
VEFFDAVGVLALFGLGALSLDPFAEGSLALAGSG